SPALDKLIELVRIANDLDGDGYGSLLGGGGLAAPAAAAHPPGRGQPGGGAKPGDGIDQNCDGHDISLVDLVAPSGPVVPIPKQFERDWNFLLLTIDATRYDHTTFGGYRDSPKHRDTT